MSDDLLLLPPPIRIDPSTPVEVCRSFSYKLNLANHGGPQYESEDFFASRKMTVPFVNAEGISELLYQECVAEVVEAVRRVKSKIQAQRELRETNRRTA